MMPTIAPLIAPNTLRMALPTARIQIPPETGKNVF
jgi:hypothetical protein